MCQEFCSQGGWWWSGPGGCLVLGGGSPIFQGGMVWSGLVVPGVSNFFWGVWWGVSNFSGGSLSNFSGGWSGLGGSLQFFGGSPTPPPPDTVNERPVRILLECILVHYLIYYLLDTWARSVREVISHQATSSSSVLQNDWGPEIPKKV